MWAKYTINDAVMNSKYVAMYDDVKNKLKFD